jgi:hypothetical protein
MPNTHLIPIATGGNRRGGAEREDHARDMLLEAEVSEIIAH